MKYRLKTFKPVSLLVTWKIVILLFSISLTMEWLINMKRADIVMLQVEKEKCVGTRAPQPVHKLAFSEFAVLHYCPKQANVHQYFWPFPETIVSVLVLDKISVG